MTAQTPQPARATLDGRTHAPEPTPRMIRLAHKVEEVAMLLATDPGMADDLRDIVDASGGSEDQKTRLYRLLWNAQQLLVEDGIIPAVTLPPAPTPVPTVSTPAPSFTPTTQPADRLATHREDVS